MPDVSSRNPRDNSPDLTGRELGDYRVLRRLGQGAMAEVYLAEQHSLGRQVAFKVLRADLATDATYLKRFEMEARAAASLIHAAIVQIYEVGCIDGVHFIAQEYVPGQNLAELLHRRGMLTVLQAIDIMRQVAAALVKAAEHNIVHRDIKPDNLMLSTGGDVKVADFGLARVTQTNEQQKLTQVGITMGSPLYMSPEQAEGKPLDTRSDIYSLGATCYEMLSGRPPFQGDTALAVAVQHVKSEPPSLARLRPDLPPQLCQLVHRMLAKDPAERIGSGAQLLQALRELPIEFDKEQVDWPDLASSDAGAIAAARYAATQHLSRVMQQEATSDARDSDPLSGPATDAVYRQPLLWIGVAVAVLVGGWLAMPADEAPLLPAAAGSDQVERQVTARAQYYHALEVDTEAAWLSVARFFPHDRQYVDLARRQLASRYLDQQRYVDAADIFGDFAARGESDWNATAYGSAGQFVLHALADEQEQARTRLAQLSQPGEDGKSLLDRLAVFDRELARRVASLLRSEGFAPTGRIRTGGIFASAREDYPEVVGWLRKNFRGPGRRPGG